LEHLDSKTSSFTLPFHSVNPAPVGALSTFMHKKSASKCGAKIKRFFEMQMFVKKYFKKK
jgi:hypothetical protein